MSAFPKASRDYCDSKIQETDEMVIDGNMTYHGECFLILSKRFPHKEIQIEVRNDFGFPFIHNIVCCTDKGGDT